KVFMRYGLLIHSSGVQRRLVHQICKVGPRKSGRASCDYGNVHIVGQWNLSDVDSEDTFAPFNIGARNDNTPVEAAGAQQCRIEDVGSVCSGNQNDAFVGLETVHFDQQLV